MHFYPLQILRCDGKNIRDQRAAEVLSFAMAGITFSDAYSQSLRRQTEEAHPLRKRSYYAFANKSRTRAKSQLISNIADMEAAIYKIIKNLDNDGIGVLKSTKNVLQDMPPHFVKHVTNWQDENNLDLMHHFIIHNKADLIAFVLGETKYFPLGYVPPFNPYAHLAAMLGYVESLRVILQYRPNAYFRIEKPSHAIKLPEAVKRKTRLHFAPKAVPKGAEKFLKKVKDSTLHAEKMMQMFQSVEARDSDVTNALNDELGALDKTFAKPEKRLPRDILLKEKKRSLSKDIQRSFGKRKRPSHYLPSHLQVKKESEDNITDHLQRRVQGREKHCITVYWDAFSNVDDNGVVKSAGEPVEIRYAPDALCPRPNIDLDRTNLGTALSENTVNEVGRPRKRSLPPLYHVSASKASASSNKAIKTLEHGVRGTKKIKDFQLKSNVHVSSEDDSSKDLNKTPLTYAAERGHFECVQFVLETVVMKRHPTIATKEPLTLATKARSPEAIMLLLEKKVTRNDYQSAVLLSIHEMYPDCLTALLTNKSRDRTALFDSTNLYHILFSQSVISSRRYELMPEMTRALVTSKEDVNSHNVSRTYPMYTLINCAFNITVGKQIFFFIDCLHILLECKANPHFDEKKVSKVPAQKDKFSRHAYSSAVECVFESAKHSMNFFESTYWSNLFTKKFITTIEMFDLTRRRVLNNILFDYMEAVCVLGLDRTILRCLLRYGGNPDFKRNGKYPINVYFDQILPYLTKFEVDNYNRYHQELTLLMFLSKFMNFGCLSEALEIFLGDHLLSAPIQALPITREFASLVDKMLRTPRPLMELVTKAVWVMSKRNKKNVRALPISERYIALIIP